jgi:hypothetical protein
VRSTKVSIFDHRIFKTSSQIIAAVSSALSAALLFVDIPKNAKIPYGVAFLLFLILIHLIACEWADRLRNITLNVEGSLVNIKTGDIFEQPGLKAIAFNEYLDTQVDDIVISRASLNGIFINSHLNAPVSTLDSYIDGYGFDGGDIIEKDVQRRPGKTIRYRLGTICMYMDFLLTAFSKFDNKNKASLTMPEYLEFLINFWDNVNRVYAQKSVSTTIFGSGITRIKGHKSISDEDLLKIMLWTFRISEMRFKYPAKLTIMIHPEKIGQINLLDIASVKNGV